MEKTHRPDRRQAIASWYHLRSLIQAFIRCRLDYCNALLAGIADTQVKRLQSVQNTAARLVYGARRWDHIIPVLNSLHWFPVRRRIIFKTAIIVSMASHLPTGSMYTSGECPISSSSTSASTGGVELSRVLMSTGQRRSFSFHGHTSWNTLHYISNIRTIRPLTMCIK